MKWIVGLLCGAVAAVVFVGRMDYMPSGGEPTPPEEVAEILDNLADTANGMIGQEAGHNVVIAGAFVNDGKYLIYSYTIPDSNGIDQKKAAKTSAEIVRQACRDRKMSKAFRGGAQITYSYRSQGGRELLAIRITQEVCDA